MTQGFPDSEECSKCEDEIGLTDVEGHYVGICKHCRERLEEWRKPPYWAGRSGMNKDENETKGEAQSRREH